MTAWHQPGKGHPPAHEMTFGPAQDTTCAFVLPEQPERTTRLLVRELYGYTQRWAPLLVEPVAVVVFVMTQTDATSTLGVTRVVLPATAARPSLRERLFGHTLAAFTARLPQVEFVLVPACGGAGSDR